MEKMYSLKTLTRMLQSFMAVMLITIMAVGNAVGAATTYTYETSPAYGVQLLNGVGEATAAPATLPYFVDFDSNVDTNLEINNGTYTNKWFIGQAQGFDNKKLYISSSNGVTNKYNITQRSTVTVSRDFIIPSTGANISFDYRVGGEADKDYLVVDVITESGTTTIATLQGVDEWTTFNYVLGPQYAGQVQIVFTWTNDAANGEQMPAAIDNISIVSALCAELMNLNITVDTTSATIQWALNDSTQTNWLVQYKLADHSEWYSVNADNTTVTLTGLQGSSHYDVRVQAVCGDETSPWLTGEFSTPCGDSYEDVVVAVSGTTATNIMPLNNGSRYSWNEMLFSADQIGAAGYISAIAFDCASTGTTMTLNTFKIYMGNTSRNVHSNNKDWTPQDELTLVYSGSAITVGGSTVLNITLDTPFEYTGENLAVVVSKSTSSANANLNFNAEDQTTNVSLYRAAAGTAYANYPVNSSGTLLAGTLGTLLPNFTVTKTSCNDVISCPDLTDFAVENVTATGADVSWTAGSEEQDNFLLQYRKVDDTEWTDIPVTSTSYTFTNLDNSTQYVVRVKAVCGENDESNLTDEITFETNNPCPMVTNIVHSNMSTTTTLSWTPGGSETAWQVRFRPTTPEGQEYIVINVNTLPTTTFGGLSPNTDYECAVKAICGDNESYWAETEFSTGCSGIDFDYMQEFSVTTRPDCWDSQNITYDGEKAVADSVAWLISPAMNVPASTESFISFDVKGDAYQVMASYRGTEHSRFTSIYEGTATDEVQHIIIPISEFYMDKMVNFAFVSTENLEIDNVEFSKCAYVPSELTVAKRGVNSMDLQWLANGATDFVLYYTTDAETWASVNVNSTNDTVQYTLEGLEGNTEYTFKVQSSCNGNLSTHESNTATATTYCEALAVPYVADFTAMPECWNVVYTGSSDQTTARVQNDQFVMYNFGTSSAAQADQIGDLFVILPNFDTTLNRLQISFDAAKFNQNISSKFYLGVITDINNPNTFYQLKDFAPSSATMSEYVYSLNGINENLYHGYLAFRMKSTDAAVPQAVVLQNLEVDYIPTCAKPINFKVVEGSMTGSSIQLTWTQPSNANNWDVKYGETGFDVETEGTNITANLLPRTVNNLEFGVTYDFYVRAHCSNVYQSEWVGPITVEMDIPYVLGVDDDITTCMATIYDDGYQDNYSNSSSEYMFIHPIDPTTTVTRLQGSYELENNYDFIYIYDGVDTNATPVYTLTGTGDLDVTSTCGPLTIIMKTNVSTTKSGFAFRVSCEAAPSCSSPRNFSFFNTSLRWENGVYGTPQSYQIRYHHADSTTMHELTSTTTSVVVNGLTVGDSYVFEVRSICGEGDTSGWVSSEIVIPCPLQSVPYMEDFDSYTSTTSYSTSIKHPECWNSGAEGTSTSYYVSIYPTSSYSHSTTNSLRFYNYMPKNNSTATYGSIYAVMPAFDANINELNISGWIRRYTANSSSSSTIYKAEMTVGVTTNLEDVLNNFTEISTYVVNNTTIDYEHFNIDLSGYTGPEGYLVLMSKMPKPVDTNTYNYFCIDDLVVDYIPECGTPDITLEGSILTIIPTSSLNAPQSYDVLVDNRVINIGNTTTYDLTNITGLLSNTEYSFQVRANCGNDNVSEASSEVLFTTPCMAYSVPYFEDFDSYESTTSYATSTKSPDCWNTYKEGTSTSYYTSIYPSTTTARSGKNSLRFYNYIPKNNTTAVYGDLYSVLPAFNANINELQLSGWIRKYTASASTSTNDYKAELIVGVVTDLNDIPGTFTEITSYEAQATVLEFEYFSLNLSEYSGPNGYLTLACKVPKPAPIITYNRYYVDDLSVEYANCLSLDSISVGNVTGTSADISWSGTASAYDIEYGPLGFTLGQGTRIQNITTTDYTITGLQGSTSYDVYVRCNCGNGQTSNWVSNKFNTECMPQALPYSEDFSAFTDAPTSSSAEGEMPVCWDYHFTGTTTGYHPKACLYYNYSPYGTSSSGFSNPYLFMTAGTSSSYGNPTYVTLPELALPLNRLSVSLTARVNNVNNATLELGYVTADGFTTLVEVPTVQTGTATPTLRVFNLDQYDGIPDDARLGFQISYTGSAATGTVYCGIDDILVEELPFCITPQIENAHATGATTATVTVSPSSNAQSYEVICTNEDDSTDVHTVTANTTDYTALFTNLTPASSYTVMARAVCSATEKSDWSFEQTIVTDCSPIALPYTEGFETVTCTTFNTNGEIPDCWKTYTTAAFEPHVIGGSTGSYRYVHSGTQSLSFYGNGYNYAVMPKFSTPVNQTMLSFWMGTESATNGTLVIGYIKENDVDMNTFTPVREYPATSTTKATAGTVGEGGETVEFNFSNCPADAYRIVFRWNYTSQYSCCIDDVVADIIPYCSAPMIDSVVTTESTAKVYVSNNADAQVYQVVCVPEGANLDSVTVTPVVADSNRMALVTGLDPITKYDFYARVICDSVTTSEWSQGMTVRTACALYDLPYFTSFEDDGTLDKESFGASYPMPYCWNKMNLGTATSYPYAYNSSTYARTGTRSLYFYTYYTTATNPSYKDQYVVLPEMNEDSVNKLRVKFFARESSTTAYYISHLEVGVMSDPTNPTTFVKVKDVYPDTTTHQEFNVMLNTYTGTGKFIAIKAPMPTEPAEGSSSHYNVTYLDDILVDYIPDCFELASLTLKSNEDTTATVELSDMFNQGSYAVEYRPDYETEWQVVTADTTTVKLTGLLPFTNYVVRAHAVCDSVHSGAYTEEITFLTTCLNGDIMTIGTGTTGSAVYLYGTSNKYSWTESVYTSDEVGGGGYIQTLSHEVVSAKEFTLDTMRIYLGTTSLDVYEHTNDWTPMENLTLVYEGTDVEIGKEKGWETFTLQTPFRYNGVDNLVIVTAKKNAETSTTPTYSYTTGTTNMTMYRYSASNEAYAEYMAISPTNSSAGYAYVTKNRANVRFMLCPYENDLALDSIAPVKDACDLSAAAITVRVKNNSYINTVNRFVINCTVAGSDVVLTDSVQRTLLPQESYLYTFTNVPFVDGSNNIEVSVAMDNDDNVNNNVIALNDVRLVVPQEVPYYQDFSTGITFGRDAWVLGDFNQNPNQWAQEDGMMTYLDNDTLDAQSYFITHCIEIPAGQYRVSYDYNALSNLPENLNVYMGTTQNISEMTLIGEHQGFVKTTEDQTFEYLFNNAAPGVYYFAVEALSQRGNMGITFDNLNVVPIVEVTVVEGANGSVTPNGVNYVVYGEDLSINIIPDEMYHLAGVWVDGERVMNEDPYNASFMMYTLENITEPHTINVEFKLEFHINKIPVNFNNAYEPGGYFIPTSADTLLDPTSHTVTFAAEPHNHFYSLVVGYQPPVAGGYVYGDDVTADVIYDDATNTYSYTLDTLIVANYYVQAMFRRDTVNIHYTSLAGDGVFDGVTVSQGNSHNTWVDYGSDFTSTIAPADGFYTMAVTVNAVNGGAIDHYDFENVTTTQYVSAQFGHMVTASINNYNNISYLGSDEVRGTIAPDTQMVVHGHSCSVSGTLQEHFHLGALYVNGVDMISDVEFNGDSYSFTIDSLISNTEIQAEVKIDQVAIYYTVVNGNGYVNGNAMNAVSSDTLYIDYMSSFLSTFEAATGYHIVNITVNGTAYDEIPQWLTEFITEPQNIVITFALNEYDITTAVHGEGSVSAGVHVVYDPNSMYVFTATPSVGHHISQVMRNNVSLPIADPEAVFTDTIAPILDNYSYVAYIEPNIYTVTASAGANGTIDPYGVQSYEYGSTPTFTVTANAGYAIEEVLVDGQAVTLTNGTYTFAPMTGNHTISATFTAVNYTINATAGNGGTIDPNGENVVPAGSTQVYTITPATGYQISDVTVDNISLGAISTYTFENVAANHTINATFSPIYFTINAVAGANGSISPVGVNNFAYGSTHTFTVTPNAGYVVDYVTVDGMEVYLTNNAYTFSNITANHEIFVAFRAANYTIVVTDPDNGAITPNGVVTVGYQATPTFTVMPSTGYEVIAINVDGANVIANAVPSVMGGYTYTFPAVTANHTLTAAMQQKSFTITITQGAHGTIAGPAAVLYGENASYTITPAAGYEVENVIVDGISLGAVTSYTLHNVTANHTITATFKEEYCVTPTALHADNIDSTSATLMWYHPGADSYDIQYRTVSTNVWTLVQNVPGFAYDLTNLQPNTYYVFQVKANCSSSNESNWANAYTFKTEAGNSSQTGIADYVKDHVTVYAEHNRVHIINDYNVEIDNVAIYDMYGKLIYSGQANNNPEVIELNVAIGTYVVRLNTTQGPAVYKVHINR